MKLTDKKIYLASKSPRRRELLRQVGVEFELLMLRSDPARGAVDVSEDVLPDEDPQAYVARVAREKGAFAWSMLQQRRQALDAVAAGLVVGFRRGAVGADLGRA